MTTALRTAIAAATLCCAANATILTFDLKIKSSGLNYSNGSSIPETYGDSVTATSATLIAPVSGTQLTATYLADGGWTPDIDVAYATRSIGNNAVVLTTLDFWRTSYGDLSQVAIVGQTPNEYAEIVLQAAPGWLVQLHGFEMGAISATNTTVWVAGASYNLSLPYSSRVSWAPSGALQAQSIAIRYGYGTASVGIDNISFSQVADAPAVPEPATMAAGLIAGLILWVAGSRR
jgi:hypothetical protein